MMRFLAPMALMLGAWLQAGAATGSVRVLEVPMHGVLPSAVVDDKGVLHVVFAVKENIFYAQSADQGLTFSAPQRVNDRADFAQVGLFRGPELAVDASGTVHVVWYNRAWQLDLPRSDFGVMYSRRPASGSFEPTRNIASGAADGMSVAVQGGNVFVSWQTGDVVRLTRSGDGGTRFERPQELSGLPCECCDTSLEVTPAGMALVVYRDRTNNNRDMYLSAVAFDGSPERKLKLDRESWNIEACPMSSVGLARFGERAFVAWEHSGAVLLSAVDLGKWAAAEPIQITGRGKYPFLVASEKGLLVGWKEGRTLHWRVYDPGSLAQREEGTARSATYDRSAGVALSQGEFLLFP
jgi:hypothetical protein